MESGKFLKEAEIMSNNAEKQITFAKIDSFAEAASDKKKIKQVRFSDVDTFIPIRTGSVKLSASGRPISILRNNPPKKRKATSGNSLSDLLIVQPVIVPRDNNLVPVTPTRIGNEIEEIKAISATNIVSDTGLNSNVDNDQVSILWNSTDKKYVGADVENIEAGIPAKNILGKSITKENSINTKKYAIISNKTSINESRHISSAISGGKDKPSSKELYVKQKSGIKNPTVPVIKPRSKQQIRLFTSQIMDDYKRTKQIKNKFTPLGAQDNSSSVMAVKKSTKNNIHAENIYKFFGPVSERVKAKILQYRIGGGAALDDDADSLRDQLQQDKTITTIGVLQPLTIALSDDEKSEKVGESKGLFEESDLVRKTQVKTKLKKTKATNSNSNDTGEKSIYFDRIFKQLDSMVNQSITNANAIVAENDYSSFYNNKQNKAIDQAEKIKKAAPKYKNFKLAIDNVMANSKVLPNNKSVKPNESGVEALLGGIRSPRKLLAEMSSLTKLRTMQTQKKFPENNYSSVSNDFQNRALTKNNLDIFNSLKSPTRIPISNHRQPSSNEKKSLRKVRLDNFFNSMAELKD